MNQLSNPVLCQIKLYLNDVAQPLPKYPLYLLRASKSHLLIMNQLSIKIAQFKKEHIQKIYHQSIEEGKMTFVLKNSLHIYVSDAKPPLLRYLFNFIRPKPEPQKEVKPQASSRRRVITLTNQSSAINRAPKLYTKQKQIKKQRPQSAFLCLPSSILTRIMQFEGGLVLSKRLLCRKASSIFLNIVKKIKLRDSIPLRYLQLFMSKAQSIQLGKTQALKEIKLSSNLKHFDFSSNTKLSDSALDLKASWVESLVVPYRGSVTSQLLRNLPISLKKVYIRSLNKQPYQNLKFPDGQMAFVINFHKNIIAYGSDWHKSLFLSELNQHTKRRLVKLKLNVLQVSDPFSLSVFLEFQQLRHLAILSIVSKGQPIVNQIPLSKLPGTLKKLKLGQFIAVDSMAHIPPLQILSFNGSLFKSSDFFNLNCIPKVLDIRDCLNVGPSVLNVMGLQVLRVCWNTNELKQANRISKDCLIKNFRHPPMN